MKIHGLVVSVNYADLLEKSIALWRVGLESLTVVTDLQDDNTIVLAQKHDCQIWRTNAFYARGAHFNKGAAQQEAWPLVPKDDWILSLDADVWPTPDWKQVIESANPKPGYLYGCWRYDERGVKIPDDIHGYGYAQLFHGSDPLTQVEPFFETCWTHAGVSDSQIMLRWRNAGRLAPPLSLRLTHAGIGPSHNWYGRGKEAEFQQMEAERRRLGGGWKSIEGERIKILSTASGS